MDSFTETNLLRAATFHEQLSMRCKSQERPACISPRVEATLSEWCKTAANGDWLLFAKRLERDSLRLDDIKETFSTKTLALNDLLAWVRDAESIRKLYEHSSRPIDESQACLFDVPIPHEVILHDVVGFAGDELCRQLDFHPHDLLTASGWKSIQYLLCKRLSDLCLPALSSRWEVYLEVETRMRSPESGELPDNQKLHAYRRFTNSMRGAGMLVLFDEKPVLLRLMAITLRQWIGFITSFLTRLKQDGPIVSVTFLDGTADWRVSLVRDTGSDPHNCGQSVLLITTTDGNTLLYKPRDMSPEVAWCALLHKLNITSPPIDLRAAKAINRQTHGWMEFIQHEGSSSQNDIARFYIRAGATLAILFVLGGTDIHYENIIAQGAYPVVVDLEMLLQIPDRWMEYERPERQANRIAASRVAQSVLSVGLLPTYAGMDSGYPADLGGLRNSNDLPKAKASTKGIKDNGPAPFANIGNESPNIPHVEGTYAPLDQHVNDLISGFREFSLFLLELRNKRGAGFVLDLFRGTVVRVIIRPTTFYFALMSRLKNHEMMADGLSWSIQADFISRLGDWELDKADDFMWAFQNHERECLMNLNIPYFYMYSDRHTIFAAGVDAPFAAVARSGFGASLERYENLTASDIMWQAQLAIIACTVVTDRGDIASESRGRRDSWLKCAGSIGEAATFQQCAENVLTIIEHQAIRAETSVSWLGIQGRVDTQVGEIGVVGDDLYMGTSGIALFLAAYSLVNQDNNARSLSYKAIEAVRHRINEPTAPRWARTINIGGAKGLGGVIYALSTIGSLFCDNSILQDAENAAALIDPSVIGIDNEFDVIGGSAGAILGLLKLHTCTGSEVALRSAIACAEYLLERRTGPVGTRSWKGKSVFGSDLPLGGMAHGASGFALAMKILGERADRVDFIEAARECLEYENGLYSEECWGWKDLRSGATEFPCRWCHGAVGVGLARIGLLKACQSGTKEWAKDIDNVFRAVSRQWPHPTDTLCCGTMGSIEFLNVGGLAMGRPRWRKLAAKRMTEVISNSIARGRFALGAGNAELNLGLFRGIAGIGYTALTFLSDSLPSVLSFQ